MFSPISAESVRLVCAVLCKSKEIWGMEPLKYLDICIDRHASCSLFSVLSFFYFRFISSLFPLSVFFTACFYLSAFPVLVTFAVNFRVHRFRRWTTKTVFLFFPLFFCATHVRHMLSVDQTRAGCSLGPVSTRHLWFSFEQNINVLVTCWNWAWLDINMIQSATMKNYYLLIRNVCTPRLTGAVSDVVVVGYVSNFDNDTVPRLWSQVQSQLFRYNQFIGLMVVSPGWSCTKETAFHASQAMLCIM